jgi:hypothetical protein
MIPTRVEKLKFIVEEMQLAFYLAMHLTDPSSRARSPATFSSGRRISSSMRGASAGHSTMRAMTRATFTRPRKPTPPPSRNTSRFQDTGSVRMSRTSTSASASSSGTTSRSSRSASLSMARRRFTGASRFLTCQDTSPVPTRPSLPTHPSWRLSVSSSGPSTTVTGSKWELTRSL